MFAKVWFYKQSHVAMGMIKSPWYDFPMEHTFLNNFFNINKLICLHSLCALYFMTTTFTLSISCTYVLILLNNLDSDSSQGHNKGR